MKKDHRLLTAWLLVGVIMVFMQILLGGITRLTGSGLSITRWDIVTGAMPPLNHSAWEEAFDLYKATPQYQKINEGMSLERFKFIYFWEYFHRVWARLMGFVFLIPFIYFFVRGSISKLLLRRLGLVISIAAAAVFGWIMVASGLINRPWVNAYKLTIHLSLGIALILALFYTYYKEKYPEKNAILSLERKWINWLFGIGIFQILLGGTLSGMKAALIYPTWPSMHGEWIPGILLHPDNWNVNNLLLYDQSGFMPALVQFLHRMNGYLLLLLTLIFVLKKTENHKLRRKSYYLLGIIVAQVLLGIATLMKSIGQIPVFYGVGHQAFGILAIGFLFYLIISTKKTSINV